MHVAGLVEGSLGVARAEAEVSEAMHPARRVQALRESSRVERFHTMPHHGSYTLGQHQYDMAMLLLVLKPDASKQLLVAVLTHDVGERWVGDVPATTKRLDPELAKRLEALEARCLKRMQLLDYHLALSEVERTWLQTLDRVELLLWSKDQAAMGNYAAVPVVKRLCAWLSEHKIPAEVASFLKDHSWERTPDELP